MAEFKPGEIVDITIKGARVIRQEFAVVVVELAVGGDVCAIPKFADITRVAPAEWPPRTRDVWVGRRGPMVMASDGWFLGDGIAHDGYAYALEAFGPLTLVHRETGAEADGS